MNIRVCAACMAGLLAGLLPNQDPASKPASRPATPPGSRPVPPLDDLETRALTFADDKDGERPRGWRIAETHGTGTPAVWRVEAGAKRGGKLVRIAETKNRGSTFNLLLSEPGYPADLRLHVRVRADAGGEDQGGGLVWRARDADNYYVTRWNPLEENLRLYKVVSGVRTEFVSVDVVTDSKAWHEIDVRATGKAIEVWFDGKRQIAHEDGTFAGGGSIGLWSKADAATSFCDLAVSVPRPGK